MAAQKPETECCPRYVPENWDDKTLEWQQKQFVKASVRTFMFMPLNFGSVMRRLNKKLQESNINVPDWLCLSDHTSKWNMDLYLAVDKPVTGLQNTTLSGKFYTRVYEGPFKDTAKWCDDYKKIAGEKGMEIKKWYMWYTTCPACAKKYGKNYVAIMGQVN
ncbi:MAG TPA: hydrolase [Bacteroidales bacterium]|nr:hydrolase [Bacteroidales bacterium]